MNLTTQRYYAVVALAVCAPFEIGCNRANTAPVAPFTGTSHAGHDHGEHAHGADPEIAEAMATLSAADRLMAERQKICPVTDEPLGSMGAPVKVAVQGRDVFICCAGCQDALNDDPTMYLAKLTK